MKRTFKTKEGAMQFLFHFYTEAFKDNHTQFLTLSNEGLDSLILKIKRYGEPLYRVFVFKNNYKSMTSLDIKSYDIVFGLETKEGQLIFDDSEEVCDVQNYFNVFKYYDSITS